MHTDRTHLDLAYLSFLVAGLLRLLVSALGALPLDTGGAGVLGLLLGVPAFLGSLVAMAGGIALSVPLWRHWRLVVLSLLSVAVVVEWLVELGSAAFYNAVPVVYGFTAVGLAGWWFVAGRRAA